MVLKGPEHCRNFHVWVRVYGFTNCRQVLESLRYKLRMFGIPLEGPVNTFCDNSSVVTNATMPESMLKKKHNSITYHCAREAIAAGVLRVAWV